MNSKTLSLAKSLRPRVILFSWLVFAAIVVIDLGLQFYVLAAGLLWFICVYGIVVIFNDLSDVKVDQLNHRDVPFAKGEVNREELLRLAIGLSVVATLCGIVLGMDSLLVMVVYILLGWLYSGPANFKSRGLLAVVVLGLCYGVTPWILSAIASHNPIDTEYVWFMASSFVFAAGIVLLKDFKDESGDRKAGKLTLLVKYGPTFARLFIIIMTSIGYLSLIIFWASQGEIFIAVAGSLIACINVALFYDPRTVDSPATRIKRGNISRACFYVYAIVSYLVVTN